MEINQELIEQLIEKEIKKQINSKIDKAIERIVTREVNDKLCYEDTLIKIAKESILSDKDVVSRIARTSSNELYDKLVSSEEDEYDDDFDYAY